MIISHFEKRFSFNIHNPIEDFAKYGKMAKFTNENFKFSLKDIIEMKGGLRKKENEKTYEKES